MGTTPKGIWFPDSGATVAPYETLLAAMQTSVDDTLDGARWDTPAGIHAVADAAGLATLLADLAVLSWVPSNSQPVYAYRADTNLLYRNIGSGWVAVIPTPASFPNVRYDAVQTLTLTEQGQARTNIAAASQVDMAAAQVKLADGGWVALALTGATGGSHYRVRGDQTWVRLGIVTTAPIAAGATFSPVTLPAGTLPTSGVYAPLNAMSTGPYPATAAVHPTTGVLTIRNLHSASASTFYVFGSWLSS